MSDPAIPDHLDRPHVRRFIPIATAPEGRPVIALREPLGLVPRTISVDPDTLRVVQLFQGQRRVDEIAEGIGVPPEKVRGLVEALDGVGLLWGPTAERLEEELSGRISREERFPAGAAFSLGSDAAEAKRQLDGWLAEAEDPELGSEVPGILAPHLDFGRGAAAYASAYRAWVGRPAPDRVIIFGTNHFGIGDGVVLSQWGFRSPLGDVGADAGVVRRLRESLGERAFADQLDHVTEHSIQLHLPWISHLFGEVPVVAALLPDPLVGLIAEDGGRATREEFVAALREAVDAEGGESLLVASVDLSHVGPQFGEPRPVDDARAEQVERHDRELLHRYLGGLPSEFLEAMEWNRNPTRWCSIGSMVAAKEFLQPAGTELIEYRQARDDQGIALVSCAAVAFLGGS